MKETSEKSTKCKTIRRTNSKVIERKAGSKSPTKKTGSKSPTKKTGSKNLKRTNSKVIEKKSGSKNLKKSNSRKKISLKNDVMQISFKDINDDYSWGKYGNFKVIIMKANGYMNATKLCQYAMEETGSRKQFRHWKENSSSEELINEVSSAAGIPTADLMITINGGKEQIIKGTYVHHKLIPHIASWASPKFAVRVADIVNEYFFKKAKLKHERLIRKKDDKIDELIEITKKMNNRNKKLLQKNNRMDKRIKRLIGINNEIYEQNVDTHNKLDVVADRSVVSTGNPKDNNMLVIIANNDPEDNEDSEDSEDSEDDVPPQPRYYVLRVMKRSYNQRVAAHQARHPDMKIIMEVNYSPNSINLWNRIKKDIGRGRKKKIFIAGSSFNLKEGYTEANLINDIQRIHDERFDTHQD